VYNRINLIVCFLLSVREGLVYQEQIVDMRKSVLQEILFRYRYEAWKVEHEERRER